MFVGIDLGTSAVKLLLMNEVGKIEKIISKEYPLYLPKPEWSEQEPDDWYTKTVEGIKELIQGFETRVKGIAVAGQMHGLVVLDKEDKVIRPAILWNDGRSKSQTDYLNNVIGKDKLSQYTANIAFAGFTAPKILWLKENEPQNFEKIKKIMLPKDYIVYKLSGNFTTDYSDASGMLLLDVKAKKWSKEMLSICDINEEMLPKLYESYESVGALKTDIASELGIKQKVEVAAGASDNAAAAVGTGIIAGASCNISLGTSGTMFIPAYEFKVDPNNALHSFAHADGYYHLMACMLSAASCNKWWMEDVLNTKDYTKEQPNFDKLGFNEVFFLPYLMGERSPHNDTKARAAFIGMSMNTKREDMTQAVMEGVLFGLRDSLEVAKKLGIGFERTTLCGGGAKSKLWRQMSADIMKLEVDLVETEEGPAYGAAILAGVACKEFESVKSACNALIKVKEHISVNKEAAKRYDEKYARFAKLYPALKGLFC